MDSRHRRSFSACEVKKKNPNGVVEERAESASVAGSENGAVSWEISPHTQHAFMSRDITRYLDKTKRKEEREDANNGCSHLSSSPLPLSESDEATESDVCDAVQRRNEPKKKLRAAEKRAEEAEEAETIAGIRTGLEGIHETFLTGYILERDLHRYW